MPVRVELIKNGTFLPGSEVVANYAAARLWALARVEAGAEATHYLASYAPRSAREFGTGFKLPIKLPRRTVEIRLRADDDFAGELVAVPAIAKAHGLSIHRETMGDKGYQISIDSCGFSVIHVPGSLALAKAVLEEVGKLADWTIQGKDAMSYGFKDSADIRSKVDRAYAAAEARIWTTA